MNLCGCIFDAALHDRVEALARRLGWRCFVTVEPELLTPVLGVLQQPVDALISDDPEFLLRLDLNQSANGSVDSVPCILLAPAGVKGTADYVIQVTEDDDALGQHLLSCVNAARLGQRIESADGREPITRLPRHRELIQALAPLEGQALSLLVVQVDHAEHLYASLDPIARTDFLNVLTNRLKLAVPARGLIGIYDAGCFIVILPGVSVDALVSAADRILNATRLPLRYTGGEIHLTVSIGGHHCPAYRGFDGLWQAAWQAVNRATRAGGDRFEGDPGDHLGRRLPHALEREEFALMLQGQWSGTELSGAEVLLRWQGLEVGELSPDRFIPLAEQAGAITRIGDWVLERASIAASSWLEHRISPLVLAVNVSPEQFEGSAITRRIERLCREQWLDPAMLELELPLEAMLRLVDTHRRDLFRLKDLGVRLAIDNLGTEVIDFDRLLRCPADTLKADRHLVARITEHPASSDVIRSLVRVGERFGLRMVAVGVETTAQQMLLESFGEIHLQGYLLGPPVPLDEFQRLLSRVSRQQRHGT